MPLSLLSLLAFAAWTLLLVTTSVAYRSVLVLLGRKRADAWPRGAAPVDDPPLMRRMRDAHLNCAENLPVFAAIVCVAAAMDALATIDTACGLVVLARVGQSITHLVGASHWHVIVRVHFFLAQIGLFFYMVWTLMA